MEEYYYGACLYPEVWPAETVEKDLQHMRKIGMNFVRMGEFIWSLLEPEDGVYDLAFLRKNLDLLTKYEMNVMVCIPTPTPPRWFTYQQEERLVKNKEGGTMEHGSRQHVCINHPYFRKKVRALVTEIAQVVKEYPCVIGIQLDNEIKAHTDLCFCDSCKMKWQEWLKTKYVTITVLNEAWGTNVWSEHYDSFAEVVQPITTPFIHNSSLLNAYREFTEDSATSFLHEEAETIRSIASVPITHNSGLGFNINNYEIFSKLDYTGFDTYAAQNNYHGFVLNLDYWRNMNDNRKTMLLETSTSHAGHNENYVLPHPSGYLQTEIFLTFASGGILFNYWHFRGHAHGCEQPHSTVVTSWGEPDVGYQDVVQGGLLLERIRPHLAVSTPVKPKIAMVYSDIGKRFMLNEPGNNYNYRSLLTDFYATLVDQGLSVDVIPEQQGIEDYDLVLIPYVHALSDEVFTKITKFVRRGGTCILGPMTGDRTTEHAGHTKHGLGKLGEIMELSDIQQFTTSNLGLFGSYSGETEELENLSTFFKTKQIGQSLGTVTNSVTRGKSFIAQSVYGEGRFIYIGSLPKNLRQSVLWQTFLKNEILPYDEATKQIQIDEGIVKYQRLTLKNEVQFWLSNMTQEKKRFYLAGTLIDVLRDEKIKWADSYEMAPFESKIIQAEPI